MECVSLLLFLLLISFFTRCRAQGHAECREKAVSAGGTLRLQLEKPPWKWAKVHWRVRLNTGHQQQILTVTENEGDTQTRFFRGPFLQRVSFQVETLSLQISSVSPADSGVYHADVEAPSGAATPLCFRVSVWVRTGDRAEVTRAVGGSVTFQIQNPNGKAAAWSFDDHVVATVIFGDPPQVVIFNESFGPRLAFPGNGNALTICQLRISDTGTYTVTTSGVTTTFALQVFKELVVPTVTCAAQNCLAGGCCYTLRCTAPGSGSGNVSYDWSVKGSLWREGPTVLLEESPPDEPPWLPLTCTARNPVSSRNVTVTSAAALCADVSWSYCWVKGLLFLLVLGSLVTAVVATHVLTRRQGPPSHGVPGSSGAGWDPPNRELQSNHRRSPHFEHEIGSQDAPTNELL